MIGEDMVYYKGKKMSANKALKQTRLQALVPFGKDSLAILSSNAYSEALAAMAVEELSHGLEVAKFVFALSIQA
uniref:Histidine ammonia-lyase n=1 Tax=Candidatus Kentrum sp. MB TaxID=2138164 RepID=A0A450XZN0_9GAMM|nr:MAG: histidine ammonia-lyase [Candidatus Kentron sp. MB]